MKILDILKKILSPGPDPHLTPPSKTIQDLEIFDTIWVKNSDGLIMKGWIFDLTRKHITVSVWSDDGENFDYRFSITRPSNQTQLKQGNNTLYLKNPCTQEK